ncbi:DUF294 nucleotidyltransferase-like domain-containing protein [Roseobacter weihaiensis]|uniref:DUF294 nucleotidyltransferase-like domain-containing protein n=1 Tax=Roseobacter weihaiensis TaxID=2763262 RepID=UPI001D0B4E45|nr:DUF294 nucleotidyltransferase-like domain-containing protein [Roseobacter sp. H9]
MNEDALTFLSRQHPYDELPVAVLNDIVARVDKISVAEGDTIYDLGAPLKGLYIVQSGLVSVRDKTDTQVSLLERGNSFGERGLLADGMAATKARAVKDTLLICLPADLFRTLREEQSPFQRFFARSGAQPEPTGPQQTSLAQVTVDALMVPDPFTCPPETTILDAAREMTARRISCLCVTADETLTGIVTLRDLVGKAMATGKDPDTEVQSIMTAGPRFLPPTAIGSDVLHMMMEYRLGHLPIVEAGRLVGIVTQTDLTRFQATTAAGLVADAARATTIKALAEVTSRIPELLLHLVSAGNRHDVVTRMITDVADVVTRRLLTLAEETLGPAPARYLWLACGSQGRQEQTGVSDQDNCLILEDGVTESDTAYFQELAKFVSDGLDACGYVYCPGDMMATNPRWCQPVSVWLDYFKGWIEHPSKEAQMLASVMFDLRPIGGDATLFDGLQRKTLKAASKNSIFTAHMASNSLTHQTPLGLLRGLATISSGDHRKTIDTKLNGVVPVVDLGRMYALQGRLPEINTRARLKAALAAKITSAKGGRDLLEAYDLVAQTRLEHQARRIKQGKAPDNYLPPDTLSDFERSHLRDAFVVIKTMQSALMQGRGLLG